jgi:hypothetical protein
MKLFFAAIVTLVVGVNCQTPDPEQKKCYINAVLNNNNIAANCPSSLPIQADPITACNNPACRSVIESLYSSCGFNDFAPGESLMVPPM